MWKKYDKIFVSANIKIFDKIPNLNYKKQGLKYKIKWPNKKIQKTNLKKTERFFSLYLIFWFSVLRSYTINCDE